MCLKLTYAKGLKSDITAMFLHFSLSHSLDMGYNCLAPMKYLSLFDSSLYQECEKHFKCHVTTTFNDNLTSCIIIMLSL